MKIERVLVILCGVILLATMLAVAFPSQTTLALPGRLSMSLDGDVPAAQSPTTFDSSVVLPAVFRGAADP
ncbi:MAG: hypothetical protein PVG71_09305 [Anaerolineae bacterium]|jgi:hypothetical protein